MDLGVKFKYPVVKDAAKSQDARHTGIGQRVLEECAMMKQSREYKETEWREANHVYQTVLDVYKRSFDQNEAPEVQYRNYFRSKDMSDIKLPVEHAIIQRKLTHILGNVPMPKWLALAMDKKDSERQALGKQFGYIFDYVWYLCDADWEMFKTIISSLIYSIGYISYFHEYYVHDIEVPDSFEDGMITYKKVTKIVSRTVVRNEDVRHILLDYNASDLRDIGKGAIIRHYNEGKFKTLFKNYSIDGIQSIKPNECFEKVGEEKVGVGKQIYECIYYYDEDLDRFAIIANGYHINQYRLPRIAKDNEGWSPIPSAEKSFPVAFWIDHYLDSELYGMGECRLSKPFREVKNKTRNMIFDVMKKVAFSTLIIDPLSDFNEDEYEFGQPFIRAELDDVKPMPVNANLDFTIGLDERTDNDVAIFTGVNIADTANPTADETATKTAARRESQFAVIENYIKQNMTNGWKRLWLGMKNSIRMGYRVPQVDEEGNTHGFIVRTDGVKLFRSGGKIVDQKMEGSFFYETTPEDFDNDMELIPEMSNVAYTKELEDELKRESITSLKEYPPEAGVVNLFKLAEIEAELGKLPNDVINPAPAQAENDVDLNQPPETVAKNLNLLAKPPGQDEMMAKAIGQQMNPEAETPSKRIPDAGTLPGTQATAKGNPAITT